MEPLSCSNQPINGESGELGNHDRSLRILRPIRSVSELNHSFLYGESPRKTALISPADELYDMSDLGPNSTHQDGYEHSPHLFGGDNLEDALSNGTVQISISDEGSPDITVDEDARIPSDITRLVNNGKLPKVKTYNIAWGRGAGKYAMDIPLEQVLAAQKWDDLLFHKDNYPRVIADFHRASKEAAGYSN